MRKKKRRKKEKTIGYSWPLFTTLVKAEDWKSIGNLLKEKRKKERKNFEEEEKVGKEKEQLLLTTASFTTLVKAEDVHLGIHWRWRVASLSST